MQEYFNLILGLTVALGIGLIAFFITFIEDFDRMSTTKKGFLNSFKGVIVMLVFFNIGYVLIHTFRAYLDTNYLFYISVVFLLLGFAGCSMMIQGNLPKIVTKMVKKIK